MLWPMVEVGAGGTFEKACNLQMRLRHQEGCNAKFVDEPVTHSTARRCEVLRPDGLFTPGLRNVPLRAEMGFAERLY